MLLIALLSVGVARTAVIGAGADPAQHVNTFIGTKNGGHVFAGATLPSGSVKVVADSLSNDNQGGFVSDGSPINGISQLHDDGTGGGSSLGNFPLLPLTNTECAGNVLTMCNFDPIGRGIGHDTPTSAPGFCVYIIYFIGKGSELVIPYEQLVFR